MISVERAQLRHCPVCRVAPSPANRIGELPANHSRLEGRVFDLAQCPACDLIYISPAPEQSDIRAMYAESSQFDQPENYRGERAEAAVDFYSNRLRALLSRRNGSQETPIRLLEIGAGLSWMCRVAKQLNPKNVTVAQDISPEAVPECAWVDRYFVADIMDCPQLESLGPYDIISMTHVIEHLRDPVATLKRVRELTAPGTLVFITAPRRPSGWSKDGDIGVWRNWSYNHVPAHIQYFSQASLRRAARLAGFELLFWDGEQEEGQVFEAWLRPYVPVASMIAPAVQQSLPSYQMEFAGALPFRHVVIDNFFEAEKAEQLLSDFPAFDPANARNEFGEVGRKATIADIRKISPFYASVYSYVASPDFLEVISEITGIPDLVHDEAMFGGGTHENLEGQELDPHVDFNYLEDRKLHRRLNLLLYLNKEWDVRWGGCLELHSDPHKPRENQIKVILPAFNRCVIFETSEHSWHGFERIRLPEGKKHLSRKLLSIYLYTRERPASEIAPPHGTFYVQRPMPEHLRPGHILAEEDVRRIEELFVRRDGWIRFYHQKELADSRRIQDLTKALDEAVRVPLTGFALQEGVTTGFWADGWIKSRFEVGIRLQEPARAVVVDGYLPEAFGQDLELTLWMNGSAVSRHKVAPGLFSLEIPAQGGAGELLKLGITSNRSYRATSGDQRELVVILRAIRVLPAPGLPRKPEGGLLWAMARRLRRER
jgi:Rps23 Pro-64 3,4-dihydroxylase Tpa1-like proline 4-hydroxylase